MRSNFEYELRVEHFLTENRRTFISPQYELLKEGSTKPDYCPDFVAITPAKKDIFVVEVSVDGGLSELKKKIKDREKKLKRLRVQLVEDGVITNDWNAIDVLLFIKDVNIDQFRKSLAPDSSVYIWPVEWTSHHWLWGTPAKRTNINFREPQRLEKLLAAKS